MTKKVMQLDSTIAWPSRVNILSDNFIDGTYHDF